MYVPHERWEGVGKVFGICTNIFKNSFPLGDSLFFFIFNFTEVIDDEKIAFYGKGGIGKSTTAANVTAAFSKMGKKVCQIGCDPKNDSTRLLLGQICRQTVLDLVRDAEDDIQAEQIVHTGFNGIKCVGSRRTGTWSRLCDVASSLPWKN